MLFDIVCGRVIKRPRVDSLPLISVAFAVAKCCAVFRLRCRPSTAKRMGGHIFGATKKHALAEARGGEMPGTPGNGRLRPALGPQFWRSPLKGQMV